MLEMCACNWATSSGEPPSAPSMASAARRVNVAIAVPSDPAPVPSLQPETRSLRQPTASNSFRRLP